MRGTRHDPELYTFLVEGSHYNSILTTIVKVGIRKINEVMRTYLGDDVGTFTREEESLLRSPLVNCRRWLSP